MMHVCVPLGYDHTWDVDLYGELLKIGGGKERMNKYFLVGHFFLYCFWLLAWLGCSI